MFFAGPTILFFQENAGSILLLLYSRTYAFSILHVFIYSVIFWAHEVLMGPIPFGHLYLLPADIAHRLEMVRIMIQRLQCNVFMLSYRGYALVAFLIHKFLVLLLSLI